MIQFLLETFVWPNGGGNTFEASTHRVPREGMLGWKLFTVETQREQIYQKKKTFWQDTVKIWGPAPPTESGQRGFQLLKEELKLDNGWFWTSFRLSVGQMLVSHLRRRSSSYPTIPNWRVMFWRKDMTSVSHSHHDWSMPFIAVQKSGRINLRLKNKKAIFLQCDIQYSICVKILSLQNEKYFFHAIYSR